MGSQRCGLGGRSTIAWWPSCVGSKQLCYLLFWYAFYLVRMLHPVLCTLARMLLVAWESRLAWNIACLEASAMTCLHIHMCIQSWLWLARITSFVSEGIGVFKADTPQTGVLSWACEAGQEENEARASAKVSKATAACTNYYASLRLM